jgi:hypothetical protein
VVIVGFKSFILSDMWAWDAVKAERRESRTNDEGGRETKAARDCSRRVRSLYEFLCVSLIHVNYPQ